MTAAIGDRGYRRYDGPRRGEWGAVVSVWRHTVQRVLGLRRTARHKILPFLTVLIAYLPAIAFVGILALLPPEVAGSPESGDFIPTYPEYFGFVSAAILLFVVFVAPEALCPDRRHRSLSLYLASPLTRDTYLLAKLLAVFSVLLLVTLGPLVLLLLGYTIQGRGPDGPLGVLSTLGRIVGAGTTVSLFFTAFACAIACLTDRKGLATGASLIVLIGGDIVANVLVFGFELSERALLLSLTLTPFELAVRILDGASIDGALDSQSTATIAAGFAAWVALFLIGVWVRYTSLKVTR